MAKKKDDISFTIGANPAAFKEVLQNLPGAIQKSSPAFNRAFQLLSKYGIAGFAAGFAVRGISSVLTGLKEWEERARAVAKANGDMVQDRTIESVGRFNAAIATTKRNFSEFVAYMAGASVEKGESVKDYLNHLYDAFNYVWSGGAGHSPGTSDEYMAKKMLDRQRIDANRRQAEIDAQTGKERAELEEKLKKLRFAALNDEKKLSELQELTVILEKRKADLKEGTIPRLRIEVTLEEKKAEALKLQESLDKKMVDIVEERAKLTNEQSEREFKAAKAKVDLAIEQRRIEKDIADLKERMESRQKDLFTRRAQTIGAMSYAEAGRTGNIGAKFQLEHAQRLSWAGFGVTSKKEFDKAMGRTNLPGQDLELLKEIKTLNEQIAEIKETVNGGIRMTE